MQSLSLRAATLSVWLALVAMAVQGTAARRIRGMLGHIKDGIAVPRRRPAHLVSDDWNRWSTQNTKLDKIYDFRLPYQRSDGSKGTACYAMDEMSEHSTFEDIKLDPTFTDYLKTLPPVTKKVHLVWSGPDLFTALAHVPLVKWGVGWMKKNNPDWEVKVYDEAAMAAYIKKHLAKSDWVMMKDAPLVVKSDLFRSLAMYHEGGLYQDVDRVFCNKFSEFMDLTNTKMLLPTLGDVTFINDFMCSSRGNKFHKRVIEIYLCKMREQHYEGITRWKILNDEQRHIVESEAMGTFWAAATETLFGRPLWGSWPHDGANQGKRFMGHIRKELKKAAPYIVTHRDDWCDLITCNIPDMCHNNTKYGDMSKENMWAQARQLEKDPAKKVYQWDVKDKYNGT